MSTQVFEVIGDSLKTWEMPAAPAKWELHIYSLKNILMILVQPHGNLGISIVGLRDILSKLKISSAVYLDGSDSVMLMINGKFIVRAASDKNETNITGIGFKY
jgi:hypothetical protein